MKTKLILLSAVLLIGCGTRKTNQTKTNVYTKDVITDNTKTETKTDTNTKVTNNTETNKETGEVTETETLEPIDNTKPATYVDENGKSQSLNNTKKTKTKTTRKTNEKNKSNVITTERKKVAETIKKDVKTKSKAKVQVKQKATESNKGNFWNWIILILLIIAFGYCFWWSRKIVKDKEKLEL
jgi:cobalamin biosynthesis Mg chelatase CobN